jgi:uncharacterized FlaG/YvyC family protein
MEVFSWDDAVNQSYEEDRPLMLSANSKTQKNSFSNIYQNSEEKLDFTTTKKNTSQIDKYQASLTLSISDNTEVKQSLLEDVSFDLVTDSSKVTMKNNLQSHGRMVEEIPFHESVNSMPKLGKEFSSTKKKEFTDSRSTANFKFDSPDKHSLSTSQKQEIVGDSKAFGCKKVWILVSSF